MPNANYERGRRKEYAVMKHLRQSGYDVVARTAGSHGPFDVIAINRERKEILFVQCKPADFSSGKVAALEKEFRWLCSEFSCLFVVE